ncbi:ubiquinol-cytochrome c reductase iron-sulfur subunit [Schumannella sp. 10F1B-5-1]|uniref:cytochrome bc1 complex Rieske iron-sulfur subunit n=1 Tax=Schumannella sp. 10F1B-5-1 TaxID=2590780 RepID=UPI00113012DB|nr:Rieske 2Fe-2S domain-containing protein [Schumannella sp. 10F1B-5-1]TPW73825.1 Rieske 2Fe-2S domain-containing protein [Schumannella sp. 10F1B-5-1]
MADHGSADSGTAVEIIATDPGPRSAAVVPTDRPQNPGFPPERKRVADLDPAKEKQQERRVVAWFVLGIVGAVGAVAAYVAFPLDTHGAVDPSTTRITTLLIGLGIALGLFGIGFGAVHWAKSLMHGHDLVEMRHPTRGTPETREKAVAVFTAGNEESGFSRRKAIVGTLIGALAAFPLPGIVLFRGLAPKEDANDVLRHTMWKKDTRLTRDPSGTPIKASEVTLGSAFHVIPEGLNDSEHKLEEKAKAAVLLMRLKPEDLHPSKGRENWAYDGIVAYSKICTHVGCPVALYEQQTHHLLCPCHQSQFDITREAEVIFGPAKRPLPQLPIYVDDEGYLRARSDFHEPVGPSFWEREH